MTSSLARSSVLILDCQTTGASPSRGQIIELAWRLGSTVDSEPLTRTFLCALPQDAPWPRRVEQLTGIQRAQLEGAPTLEEVGQLLVEDLRGTMASPVLAIAHSAPFEARFVTPLLAGHGAAELLPPWLCSQRLSRWLIPELPSYTLRAVAGHLGHPVAQLRRAAEHVYATFEIWREVMLRLEAQGIDDPVDLADRVRRRRSAPGESLGKRFLLPADLRCRLPDEPGVYQFTDAAGKVLYVGKATRLRSRVSSYVGSPRGKAGHTREMLAQTTDVQHTVTVSPFEAALLEARLIQKFEPPYNRVLRPGLREVVYASDDLSKTSPERTVDCGLGPLPSTWPVLAGRAVLRLAQGLAPSQEQLTALLGPQESLSPDCIENLGQALRASGVEPEAPVARLMALGWVWDQRSEEEDRESPDKANSSEPPQLARVHARCVGAMRHLSRAFIRAFMVRVLRHCTVVYFPATRRLDEPGRAVVLSQGLVRGAVDLAPGQDPPWPESPASPGPNIDRAEYDRQGVVIAELKKLAIVGRLAWIALPDQGRVSGAFLAALFAASE